MGLQEDSDSEMDFEDNWTSKFQVKQSRKTQHLKACVGDKKQHIYMNVKDSTSSKKQMMQRKRTEQDMNNESKDSPVTCTTYQIIAVVLGVILFVSLGTTAFFLIKGCPCPRCPEHWMAYQESCYSFSKEKKDWHSSQQACHAQGAHLLVINNASEMDFFLMIHNKSHWIGLQNSTGGNWAWEDGSKLSGKRVLHNSPVQNCGILLDGVIRASSCEFLATWICERSLQ